MYTGKSLEPKTRVGYGDVAIQTFHLLANSMSENGDDEELEELVHMVEFFEEYIWVPSSSGGQQELKEGRIVTAIPGIGVLGGYNPKLTNADWNHSAAYGKPTWNEAAGVAHPGRGASSTFYEASIYSSTDIPAGMEIFVNYGDNWSEDDDDDEDSDELTKDDHTKVDETIEKILEFFAKHPELEEPAKTEIYNFLVRDVMAAAAGNKKGAKITNMLPDSPDELHKVKEAGGSLTFSDPTTIRSLDWLQTYGRCMDNIKPGPSTISHAGRGAFAARAIPEGGLVAPVPLVQIPNEDILLMHPIRKILDEEEDVYVRSNNDIIGTQLLLNYCYGHEESSLLFFPAGAVASFINHSKEKANAKMVWSDHPNNHKHWFELDPSDLIEEENMHLGLMMEIVATRPIKEGEEVFIDYGDEWQAAWDEHVASFKALNMKEWPIRAIDLNGEYKTKAFPTIDEQKKKPLPETVEQKCFLMVKKPADEEPVDKEGRNVRVWAEPDNEPGRAFETENLFDCSIVDKKKDGKSWTYTILWEGSSSTTVVKNVPHRAVVFLDKPETSDQHYPGGFRHYIGIPDEIFPQGPWRNLGEDDEDDEDDDDEED